MGDIGGILGGRGLYGIWDMDMDTMSRSRRVNDRETVPFL